MAKNTGREFATMDEEERRRFALESKAENEEAPEELDLTEPRGDDVEEPPRPREG
jgi:hypothetical protein